MAPPPPPLAPLPGFGDHPQVQRQFERMNMNATEPLNTIPRPPPQYHQQPIYRTIQPDHPTARPAPKTETPLPLDSNGKVAPYYEGFTFTRLDPKAGEKKTWGRAVKTAVPLAHEELASLIRKQQAKGISVARQYKELGTLRRAQVDRLIAEKNESEKDRRLIWKLASVESDERKKQIVSMQVIIKKILKPDVVQASTGNGKVKVMAGDIIELDSAMGKSKTSFIPGPGLKLPSQLHGGQGSERIYHVQPGHPMMPPQGQQQQQRPMPIPVPEGAHPGGHPGRPPMPHTAAQQGMHRPMVEIIGDRLQPNGQRPPVMHFPPGQGQPMPQGMPPQGMPPQGMPYQGMPPRAQPPLAEVVHDRMPHFHQSQGPPKIYHQQGHPFAPHPVPKSPKKSHAKPKAGGKPHKRVEEWRATVVDTSDESESDAGTSIFSHSDSSDNFTVMTPESSHREREKPKEKPRRESATKEHRKRDSHSHSHRSRDTQGPVYREHRRRSPVPSLSPKERKPELDIGDYVVIPARTLREGFPDLKRLNTTRGERPTVHRRGESFQDHDHHRDLAGPPSPAPGRRESSFGPRKLSETPYRSERIEQEDIALERALERTRNVEHGREMERERQKELERERQRGLERGREMERERLKEEREMEKERDRERVRERERERETESRERARLDDLLYRREHERVGFGDRMRMLPLRDLGFGYRDRY